MNSIMHSYPFHIEDLLFHQSRIQMKEKEDQIIVLNMNMIVIISEKFNVFLFLYDSGSIKHSHNLLLMEYVSLY